MMNGIEVRIDSSRPIFITASADDIGAVFARMSDVDQIAVLEAMVKQIQALEKQHQDGKENLLVHVLQFWTHEEISKAEAQWGKEFRP